MIRALCCLAVGAIGLPVWAEPSYNLPATFADTKAKLAAGGQADILVLGDSLSFSETSSYLPYFRSLMQATYGNAGAGYQGFSLWTGAGFNNGWLRDGINTDVVPHRSLDGLWSESSNGAFPNQAFFDLKGPTFQLQYLAQPGGGTAKVYRVDQGQETELTALDTSAAASGVRTFSYTFPTSSQQLEIVPAGDGLVTILGATNTLSAPGIRVHRAANGGWGVNSFLQRDASFDAQVGLVHPDLVMIWLGQNDQGYTRATYAPLINQLVDRVQADAPGAEVLLIGTYDSGSPAISGLVDAMDDVAHSRAGVGFLNVYEDAGDYQFFVDHGYLADGIHFSEAGGQYLGNMLFQAFQSDGASLAPEPASLGLLAAGASLLLLRRRR